VIEISLLGSVYCTSAAIASLIERKGLIIGISSIAGFSPLAGRTGYAAAKHGLTGFMDTLRTEVADAGVGVMMVHATYIMTNIDKNALDGQGDHNQNEKIPSGNVLMPDEAAEAVFLAAGARERQLLLGDNAQAAWDLWRSDPSLFEQIMMDMNRYVLEQ
jgi:NAD(P)-dependent dehydrogenase (short-subunit alcohol dehydrogenase family)